MTRTLPDIEGAARPPHVLARALVHASTHGLPSTQLRWRYDREFLAELHGMSAARQTSYALGLLAHAGLLRRALATTPDLPLEDPMPRKPIVCRLTLHHRWRTESTEDGNRYRRCTRCGKFEDYLGTGHWGSSAGIIGGGF